MDQEKENGKKDKSFFGSILEIVKDDRFHILWLIVMLIVGTISIWSSFFLKGAVACFEELKNSSDLYIISIGFLATCSFDLATTIYIERKNAIVPHFIKVKLIMVFLGFIVCMLVPFIAIGFYRTNLVLKVLLSIGMLLLSYLCYLTQFLSLPKNSNLDDNTFHEDEKREEANLIKNATNAVGIIIDGEDIKI